MPWGPGSGSPARGHADLAPPGRACPTGRAAHLCPPSLLEGRGCPRGSQPAADGRQAGDGGDHGSSSCGKRKRNGSETAHCCRRQTGFSGGSPRSLKVAFWRQDLLGASWPLPWLPFHARKSVSLRSGREPQESPALARGSWPPPPPPRPARAPAAAAQSQVPVAEVSPPPWVSNRCGTAAAGRLREAESRFARQWGSLPVTSGLENDMQSLHGPFPPVPSASLPVWPDPCIPPSRGNVRRPPLASPTGSATSSEKT